MAEREVWVVERKLDPKSSWCVFDCHDSEKDAHEVKRWFVERAVGDDRKYRVVRYVPSE